MEGLFALAFPLCLLLVLVLFPKKCIIYLLSYFTRNTRKKLESHRGRLSGKPVVPECCLAQDGVVEEAGVRMGRAQEQVGY